MILLFAVGVGVALLAALWVWLIVTRLNDRRYSFFMIFIVSPQQPRLAPPPRLP